MMEFHQTGMGRDFYEGTMPRIERYLGNISKELEVQSELKRKELKLKERELEIRERELQLLQSK